MHPVSLPIELGTVLQEKTAVRCSVLNYKTNEINDFESFLGLRTKSSKSKKSNNNASIKEETG